MALLLFKIAQKGIYMDTKRSIQRLLEFDNTISNQLIADTLGISRQLVSYHTRRLPILRRSSGYRTCTGCSLRLSKQIESNLCSSCRKDSFGYEFVCAQCGAVKVVVGRPETRRRYDAKRKIGKRDFCTRECSSTYAHNQKVSDRP